MCLGKQIDIHVDTYSRVLFFTRLHHLLICVCGKLKHALHVSRLTPPNSHRSSPGRPWRGSDSVVSIKVFPVLLGLKET